MWANTSRLMARTLLTQVKPQALEGLMPRAAATIRGGVAGASAPAPAGWTRALHVPKQQTGLMGPVARSAAEVTRRAAAPGAGSPAAQAARRAMTTSAEPSPGMMAAILAFPKSQPFATNIMVATVKTSIADLIAQVAVEGRDFADIDWKRNMVFVTFGAVYLGGFQWFIQVNMFRRWFPTMDRFANQSVAAKLKDTAGQIEMIKQCLFDVFVHLPFMYYPTFYVVKEFVQGDSWNPVDWVTNGFHKYFMVNFVADCSAMLMVWAPADLLCFSIPVWLRLPVRHVVSLGWTSYLSFLRGS